jgi:hypothetical protein
MGQRMVQLLALALAACSRHLPHMAAGVRSWREVRPLAQVQVQVQVQPQVHGAR